MGHGAIPETALSGPLWTREQDGQRELGPKCGTWVYP